MQKKKKKGWKILLILCAFLVPILVAFAILMENQNPDPARGIVSRVTLTHEEDTEEVKKRDQVEFFIEAAKSGSPIEKAADDLSSYRRLDVVFHKINNDIAFVFYLSDSENNCVYTDAEGKLFLFDAQTAKKIQNHPLLGGYGLSFAHFPEVTLLQGGENYEAAEIRGDWAFVDTDGEDQKDKVIVKSEARAILPQGEKLNLNFSIQPDYCALILSDEEGKMLYSGEYEEMNFSLPQEDTNLSLTVQCDWYEEQHEEYHGSLTYTFEVFYDIPTLCTFDRLTARPGEEIRVEIAHSSSQSLAVNPSFSSGKVEVKKEGKTFVATIPVDESAAPGEYTVMILGSDVEKTFHVNILP